MGREAIPMQINAGDSLECNYRIGTLELVKPNGRRTSINQAVVDSGGSALEGGIKRTRISEFEVWCPVIAATHGLRAGVLTRVNDRLVCQFEHATAPASVSQ